MLETRVMEKLNRIKLIQFSTEVTTKTCGQCRKFHTRDCSLSPILETDPACSEFEKRERGRVRGDSRAKRRKPKEWHLDLFAHIPQTLKPCGFYGDTLTESVWLPYRSEEKDVKIKPSVIMVKKELPKEKPFKIIQFWNGEHEIRGTFPSQELQTLMNVKAVQMLEHLANVEPQTVDQQISEAFKKHLEMPQAETILCKRWIEGTYFYDIFDSYPIESILGVSESGKSRLCLVNLALCYHAEGLIDPTEASIFRAKEEDRVSLIVDEAEYLNNPHLYSTLRILLNASYSKSSGYVTRYDEEDGKRIKRRFDLYSPMCIAGIAGLEGVTLSRAFRIVMRRINKDYPKAYIKDYNALRDFLYVLRIRHCFEVSDLYRELDISNIVTARFEELFKPIFALTKFMGTQEEWEILSEWCKQYQENFRAEALNVAEEELVLLSLSKTESEIGHPDWYNLKDITKNFNVAHFRQVSPKYTSNVLYRLGLVKRKKLHGYTLVYAPADIIEEACKRIGVRLPELPTLPSHPTQPIEEWKDAFERA
jgi:hypothetical protein